MTKSKCDFGIFYKSHLLETLRMQTNSILILADNIFISNKNKYLR